MMKNVRLALLINAIFSTITGLALLLFGSFFTHFFGLTQPLPLYILGVGLLGFAWSVYRESRAEPLRLAMVKMISLMDIVWVVASLALIALNPFGFSFYANMLIFDVALAVSFFAFHQLYAVKHTLAGSEA